MSTTPEQNVKLVSESNSTSKNEKSEDNHNDQKSTQQQETKTIETKTMSFKDKLKFAQQNALQEANNYSKDKSFYINKDQITKVDKSNEASRHLKKDKLQEETDNGTIYKEKLEISQENSLQEKNREICQKVKEPSSVQQTENKNPSKHDSRDISKKDDSIEKTQDTLTFKEKLRIAQENAKQNVNDIQNNNFQIIKTINQEMNKDLSNKSGTITKTKNHEVLKKIQNDNNENEKQENVHNNSSLEIIEKSKSKVHEDKTIQSSNQKAEKEIFKEAETKPLKANSTKKKLSITQGNDKAEINNADAKTEVKKKDSEEKTQNNMSFKEKLKIAQENARSGINNTYKDKAITESKCKQGSDSKSKEERFKKECQSEMSFKDKLKITQGISPIISYDQTVKNPSKVANEKSNEEENKDELDKKSSSFQEKNVNDQDKLRQIQQSKSEEITKKSKNEITFKEKISITQNILPIDDQKLHPKKDQNTKKYFSSSSSEEEENIIITERKKEEAERHREASVVNGIVNKININLAKEKVIQQKLDEIKKTILESTTYMEKKYCYILKNSLKSFINSIILDVIKQNIKICPKQMIGQVYQIKTQLLQNEIDKIVSSIDDIYCNKYDKNVKEEEMNEKEMKANSTIYVMSEKDSFKEIKIQISCEDAFNSEIPQDF
ncbi:hypothetical protein M9Y10_029579 [Tritrichomonas musculus]|uniref:Uncharacterized protein n=1 Tax=Tritrichomonas musculus TaxID=1915356 RepID=A0ABR2KNE6_9EUKA